VAVELSRMRGLSVAERETATTATLTDHRGSMVRTTRCECVGENESIVQVVMRLVGGRSKGGKWLPQSAGAGAGAGAGASVTVGRGSWVLPWFGETKASRRARSFFGAVEPWHL
jgi:hypothetical protein